MTLRKTTKSESPLVPVSDEQKRAIGNKLQDGQDLQQAVREADDAERPTDGS